jgi:MFS transporter, Spinster family, sphingosine-1-phosphate transporter
MQPANYKKYLLVTLMIILAFNYVDRLALGIVLQDIKKDLALTDTQLGLLTGMAFAFFYATMGIPIARWADRGNRITIITLTTALWSIAVALCGAVTTFVQLVAVRIAASVGEAGCVPPAHSLLADYFTREERPRAVAIYMLGGPLALMIGYFTAGWLNELYGWKATFVIFGLPGIGLALLAKLTLREPRLSQQSDDHATGALSAGQPAEPSVRQVCVALWKNPAFMHLLCCFSVWGFFGSGILQWLPAFFVRSHGLQTGELGTWLAVIYGLGGGLGTYLGGVWASRYAGDERRQLVLCAGGFMLCAIFYVCTYAVRDTHLAFVLLTLGSFGIYLAQGPVLATMQTLVAPRMRAMAIALVYMFANLIGTGLGPLATGALSDALQPSLHEESLRGALLLVSPGFLWAAWHLLRASKTVARDIETVQTYNASRTSQHQLAVVAD